MFQVTLTIIREGKRRDLALTLVLEVGLVQMLIQYSTGYRPKCM